MLTASPETLLSNLKLHRVIGSGAFADVYSATFYGSKCAVKILKRQDAVQARMLAREAALQIECTHPNIVRVHALLDLPASLVVGARMTVPGDVTAMVMEMVEDGTIAVLLARQMSQMRAPLYHDTDVLRWCVGIAEALAFLHSRSPQVIHRDIKAENIMLGSFDGKKRHTAKLADFGLHVAVQNSQGQIVRKRSRCPSISGLETSLRKATNTAPISEKLFLRWDDPSVLSRGIAPRPSLSRSISLSPCLQQLSIDTVTILVEGSASNLDRVACGSRSGTGLPQARPNSLSVDGIHPASFRPNSAPSASASPSQLVRVTPPPTREALLLINEEYSTHTQHHSDHSEQHTNSHHQSQLQQQGQHDHQQHSHPQQQQHQLHDYQQQKQQLEVSIRLEPLSPPMYKDISPSPAFFTSMAGRSLPPRPPSSSSGSASHHLTTPSHSRGSSPAAPTTPPRIGSYGDTRPPPQVTARAVNVCPAPTLPKTAEFKGVEWSSQKPIPLPGLGGSVSNTSQYGASRTGVSQNSGSEKGVTQKGVAQYGVSQKGDSQHSVSLKGDSQHGASTRSRRGPLGGSHEFESVFRLTGKTGSAMYMSPEMHRNQPYNEKIDVYSFGILMYELFSRQLMALVVAATRESLPVPLRSASDYSQLAADGYRPVRPKRMRDDVWELIQSCWHADPVARPAMSEVLLCLMELQAEEAERVGGGVGSGELADQQQPSCCTIS